ncbi:aspartic proteinase CDR1-like [Quercus robur]|uniref:aspartic proteinase CDR1-like n=1 Tax=Quercus robur TaxID=38942 RepID=UPI00216233D6|nr:aspartic proteinase CDR1-like [Quercus robur]
MKFSNGTPPVDIYGSADAGSNLVWTQCLPFDACFKQIHPMFDFKKSSTYREISCQSEEYRILLDEATVLLKIFAITRLDMLLVCPKVFGPKKKLPLILPQGKRNPLTLLLDVHTTQAASITKAMQREPLGKISFGNGCEVVGDGVVSTPYVGGDQYYLTLEGISVGDTYVPFNSSGKVSKGNICMDSGSPPLTLPPDFYDRLVVEVKKQISIDPIKNDTLLGTRLCYRTEINQYITKS